MLLLDTHALLWFLEGQADLPETTRATLEAEPEVFVSVASLWEITIKLSIGKLRLAVPFEELVEVHLPNQRLRVLPVTPPHLIDLQHLPLHHRDPFDRMLVSQARVENLTLVSRDERLRAYEVAVRW